MEEPESLRQIRRGWCFGNGAFREELKQSMMERVGPNHYGEERQQTAEVRALRVLDQALREQGLRIRELKELRQNDPKKVSIAMRLRAETTLAASWIAEKLGMSSTGYLNRLLYLKRKA